MINAFGAALDAGAIMTAVPFSSTDYTASAGTWTVASVDTFDVAVVRNWMLLNINIHLTNVSTTPNWLGIKLPLGKVAAAKAGGCYMLFDASLSVGQLGVWSIPQGSSIMFFQKANSSANMTATASNNTGVWMQGMVRI